jgi:hypothetical protein
LQRPGWSPAAEAELWRSAVQARRPSWRRDPENGSPGTARDDSPASAESPRAVLVRAPAGAEDRLLPVQPRRRRPRRAPRSIPRPAVRLHRGDRGAAARPRPALEQRREHPAAPAAGPRPVSRLRCPCATDVGPVPAEERTRGPARGPPGYPPP